MKVRRQSPARSGHHPERRAILRRTYAGAPGRRDDSLSEPFPFPPDDPHQIAGYVDGPSFGAIDLDGKSIRFTAVSERGYILDEIEMRKLVASSGRIVARHEPIEYHMAADSPVSR